MSWYLHGKNHRNPPGNPERMGYYFCSISKIIGHFDWAAILDFEHRKTENHFF